MLFKKRNWKVGMCTLYGGGGGNFGQQGWLMTPGPFHVGTLLMVQKALPLGRHLWERWDG